ncbi:acyltransferase [Planococcus sp. 4-30]|uniref:acyltransferase n=1 Tax=Planococcus sp. 4-30 TaxID=2874583 RepID=UPI001CC09BC0|nr:acyltransferase [Planococcus sp. 4-30]
MFKKYRKVILLFSYIFKPLPNFFLKILWDSSGNYSGNLSVALRYCVLKNLAKECGGNVYIGKYVTIKNFEKLIIGENVSIHDFSYIEAKGGLTIGDNVSIAHNSSILTSSHTWDNTGLPIKYNVVTSSPVIIHEDVWIGCGVRILNGVTINSRSVVAAGSIVNKNIEANSLVAGVPIKKIKDI